MSVQAPGADVFDVQAAPAMGGRFRMSWSVVILALILAILIVPPAWFLFNVSVHVSNPDGTLGQFTLQYYASLFTERFFLPSLINTIVYSLGTAWWRSSSVSSRR